MKTVQYGNTVSPHPQINAV